MIKFTKTNVAGQRLLGFGLSQENMKRLAAGDDIFVNLSELGVDHTSLYIFVGDNEEQMIERVKREFGDIKEQRNYK